MANEYLTRRPTSTGNQTTWTWAGWVKLNNVSSSGNLFQAGADFTSVSGDSIRVIAIDNNTFGILGDNTGGMRVLDNGTRRDPSSWYHIVAVYDSTAGTSQERAKLYINGVAIKKLNSGGTFPAFGKQYAINAGGKPHYIGILGAQSNEYVLGELTDLFFVDGQALTPDVFGFYKQGKGYISAGSAQATDFRPGQWVPKTPRAIKTEINRRGGFGVNGFYLPMNDSKNFGADFHCDPNSIITLNEKLPQPRVGVASTAAVGLGFTDVLRADPYAANLLVACPFVSGGLGTDGTVSSTIQGLGDYHRVLGGQSNSPINFEPGNGTQATVAIGTGVYYGSSLGVSTSSIRPRASVGAALTIVGDYTIEFWAYVNSFASDGTHLIQYDTPNGSTGWAITNDFGTGRFLLRDNGGTDYQIQTTVGVTTTGQWNHWAGVYQRNKNTITLYVNGVAVGINTNVRSDYPSAQYYGVNPLSRLHIGSNQGDGSRPMLGYMQDLRIYNTAKYKGGFDVPKPYTPVGIATWRAVPDTTANNFATLNPLDRANNTGTLTDGNLSNSTTGSNNTIRSTVGVSTGKWYWEFRTSTGTMINHHGIVATDRSMSNNYIGFTPDSWGMYEGNGNKRNNASFDSYGSGFSVGEIGMCALDKTNGKIYWGKSGTWFASGDPAAGTNAAFTNINDVCGVGSTSSHVAPAVQAHQACTYNFGQNPTFSGNTTAGTFTDTNGKGLFKYQPPSGFLALCEDNLPTPAIKNPGEYFRSVLWTGDGASGRSITGIGFTPDLVWIKSRNNAAYGHKLFDSIRGPKLQLESNATDGDISVEGVYSFNSDGFSIGSYSAVNQSTYPFVAWCWRAGAGTTSTNTNGSITSVVSVNQDAGFSIVSWTATGSVTTVGHGLGKKPKLVINKPRSGTYDWAVITDILNGTQQYLYLNSTQAVNNTGWGTNPTDSVMSAYSYSNGLPMISYCWAEIEGFSKFGSYVGNGSADGPFVFTNGRPAFVMIKRTDTTNDWVIFDSSRNSTNPATAYLEPNTSDIETTDSGSGSRWIDILSNGFKIRETAGALNASGGTYIFACFMESPFTTANSK